MKLKNILQKSFLFCFIMSAFAFLKADTNSDKLIGVWEPSHGRARVKVDKIADKYYGKIVWLKEPIDPETKAPKTDSNNPDESMRSVPLKGYRILKDFVYKGNGEWNDGTIYDPLNGSTYSCIIQLKDDNTLEIRGYVGVKTFGRTDVWKRVIIKK